MNPFETETMAELYLRQGHHGEARAIYRRLLARTEDEAARDRIIGRLAALEKDGKPRGSQHEESHPERIQLQGNEKDGGDGPSTRESEGAMGIPGVRARWSTEELTIEWRLPAGTEAPGLEVLLVKTGAGGVSTERRQIEVAGSVGRLKLGARNLHSVRVAAGSRGPRGFVPLVRG